MREVPRTKAPIYTPTLLDRAVSYLSPQLGLARYRAGIAMAMVGGYTGARKDRRATQEWRPTHNSADADIIGDLPALRERSRDLVRNAPIATGAIGTIVENVVATGLSLQSMPDAETLGITDDEAAELGEQIERKWLLWSESPDCDITRTQNFYGLQELGFRSALESGDCFALLPYDKLKDNPFGLRVQVIEGDRVETPQGQRESETLAGGVERDPAGAPVAYHFLRKHPGDIQVGSRESDRIPAFTKRGRRNVLHLYYRTRPGQSRGVPLLAPVVESLKQLDRYHEAEIAAAVLNAYLALAVETPDGEGLAPPVQQSADSDATSSAKQGTIKIDGPGQIIDLMPGQKVLAMDTKRPNQAFEPFVLAMSRSIGAAIGLPFEILVKHFTASYSASRAAMLEAWRFFRGKRAWLALHFCDPVFHAWLDEAVAIGEINAPGYFEDPTIRRAYQQCEWIGDAPGHIDPVKETQASVDKIEGGLSNKTIETLWVTGRPWRSIQKQRAREIAIEKSDGTFKDPDAKGGVAVAEPPNPDDPNDEDLKRERENT